MRNFFRSFKDINSLEKTMAIENIISSKIVEYRKKIRILVIDDQEFTPQSNLTTLRYNIDYVSEIPNIDTVKDYHIILCDLKGVGRNFDKEGEGATLIRQIKREYPSIFIIAYSGGADADIIREVKEYADSFLAKDASITEWTEKLDNTIHDALNPVHAWKKVRVELLKNITPYELAILEDEFVRSLVSGKQKDVNLKKYNGVVKELLNTCYHLMKLYVELTK